MPRKILNKIIRQIDTEELQSFTLDRRSGELCYLEKNNKKTLKIPEAMCKDFFLAVEKSLTKTNKNQGYRFRLLTSRGNISISLDNRDEDGEQKIQVEIKKTDRLIHFKHLGFNLEQQKIIHTILRRKKGLIVTGIPAGDGLSNVIYALASELNLEEKNAYLLSPNQEHKISGLHFIPLENPTEDELRKKLNWLDKADTDIIIVPEIYERQTAMELVKLANSGHLIIAGCRSRDSFSVLNSFLKAGPIREVMANFSLIISGRKLKKICPHCVEKHQITNTEINAFSKRFAWKKGSAENLLPKKTLYSIGCPKCHYRGNLGKIGLYEVLALDQDLKKGENILAIRDLAFSKGYRPLIINALAAAKNGLISLQEILGLKI